MFEKLFIFIFFFFHVLKLHQNYINTYYFLVKVNEYGYGLKNFAILRMCTRMNFRSEIK